MKERRRVLGLISLTHRKFIEAGQCLRGKRPKGESSPISEGRHQGRLISEIHPFNQKVARELKRVGKENYREGSVRTFQGEMNDPVLGKRSHRGAGYDLQARSESVGCLTSLSLPIRPAES